MFFARVGSNRNLHYGRGRRRFRRPLFALAALCVLALCGCSAEESDSMNVVREDHSILNPDLIKERKDPLLEGVPAVTNTSHDYRLEGVVPDVNQNLVESIGGGEGGGTDANGRQRGPDSDYIDKADVYWKLNWIRKAIATAPLPPNLAETVAKTRRQLQTVQRDANYDVADAALKHLEQGLEHLRAHQTLEDAYISRKPIPWSGGRFAVQRFIDSNGLGFAGKSPTSNNEKTALALRAAPNGSPAAPTLRLPLSRTQQQCLDILLDYATRYRASPEQMMQQEWKAATEKINELRDNLGLMDRKENSDGESLPSERATVPLPKDTGVKGVVPIPGIGDGATDLNAPLRAPREPADSFGQ